MALVRVPDVGSAGLIADLFAQEAPLGAWSDVRNARFADGYAAKGYGYGSALGTPSVAPYGLFYAPSNTTRFFAYTSLTKAYCTDGATHTNITRQTAGTDVNYTGTADDKWTGVNLSGILVFNNGVDAPQYWVPNASNKAAALTNWPASTTCKAIRGFKNHLIALDVTKSSTRYPYMVKWSHPADPGAVPVSWDETNPAYDAGELDLGDSYGEVVDGGALNDVFIVWKQNATYALRYVSAPYIFTAQRITDQSGILARNCWAETPQGLVVVSLGDVVLQAGDKAPQSIIDGRNRRWLFDNLSQTYFARTFVVHNEDRQEVLIVFPSQASTGWCDKALVWNYVGNTWTQRDIPAASAGVAGYVASTSPMIDTVSTNIDDGSGIIDAGESALTAPRIVVASATNTKLYALDSLETADGTAMTTTLERVGLAFDAPERVKLVRSVRPRIDGVVGQAVNVYVGGAMYADEAPSWAGPYSYTIGSTQKVDCLVTGRYIGVRFEAAISSQWRIKSYDIDVQPQGLY